ncbi:tyrosine-type recombinase/integrase [Sulfurimonas sp.]|uniref:tyrosine-type recombinase/integrase n=1 Tax=Sulfurimonas sp. TaxID=2022749 RepID=UPI0025D58FDB|nr:tyrosine-type recombinase/integrase [Sulfurimonas sp.]
MTYAGIKTKVMNDGSKHIYVQFKHLSKRYPEKNFTKLFGCKTQKQAFEKLQEIKLEISRGKDPFISTKVTLNDLYDERKMISLQKNDWKPRTVENYDYFYNRYVRNTIGHKKPSKITYEDLRKLYDVEMAHVENSTKNQFKRIVRPIFVEEIKKGNIYTNVIDSIETYKMPVREHLQLRTDERNIDIVRKLYRAIPQYEALAKSQKEEFRAFLMLVIMTAHRHGELRQLRIEDCYIDKKMIIAPKTITKTKEDYRFPLPDEIIPYLQTIKSGLIFPTLKKGSVDMMFQRLLKLAGVETFNGKRLSPHDLRRLMLTIMIRDLRIDSVLADTCLNHKQRGVIKHYLSFDYDDVKTAYSEYWDYVRKK